MWFEAGFRAVRGHGTFDMLEVCTISEVEEGEREREREREEINGRRVKVNKLMR